MAVRQIIDGVEMTALRGYRVLELAESVSGEYCGKLLADFGAEIIKVERPGGSPVRGLGRAAGGHSEGSGLFAYLNMNKKSVILDLPLDSGSDAFKSLLDYADIVIDDHDASWLDAAGLNLEDVRKTRPALIICSITPYGLNPPADRLYAEDINVFHTSGWGYHNPSGSSDDEPPLKAAGQYLVSYESGLDAALSIVASLYEREHSQTGQSIEVSKQQVMASRTDYVLGQMIAGDMDVSTSRRGFDLGGPSAIFRCRDGFVYFWISDETQWEALRQLIGGPEWMDAFPKKWLEQATTPERVATCRRELTAWLMTQDRNTVSEEAQKRGLMMVPVYTAPDLLTSPQHEHRKFFTAVDQPGLGRLVLPTVPYKLSLTPAAIEAPAPAAGQHTREILAAAATRNGQIAKNTETNDVLR